MEMEKVNDYSNMKEINVKFKFKNILLKNVIIITVFIIFLTLFILSFVAIFRGRLVFQTYLFEYYIYYIFAIIFFTIFITILEIAIKYRVIYETQHLIVFKKNMVFDIDKDNFVDVMYFKRFYNLFGISICSIRFDFILNGKLMSLRILLSRANAEIIYSDFIKLNDDNK